ncbi:hypothetical protein [Hydrogenovibrio marinus]|nr:hypothetical protein [Hydrogenovibrio marinus]
MNRYGEAWFQELYRLLPTLPDMTTFVKSSEDFQDFMLTEGLKGKLEQMRHINSDFDFIAPFE